MNEKKQESQGDVVPAVLPSTSREIIASYFAKLGCNLCLLLKAMCVCVVLYSRYTVHHD